MKKIQALILVLCFVAGMAMAAETNVTSVNVVGYVKVQVVPGFNLLGLNLEAVGGTDPGIPVSLLFSNQLTGAGSAGTADNVICWDRVSQRYVYIWKYDDGANVFWLNAGGELATNVLYSGDGFWVLNRHPSAQDVTLAGEVVNVATGSVPFVHGFNFFGFPFSAGKNIQTTSMTNDGAYGSGSAGTADNIIAWDKATQRYQYYWYYDDGVNKFWLNAGGELATNVLALGEGFWYQRRGAGGYTWSEPKPYNLEQ